MALVLAGLAAAGFGCSRHPAGQPLLAAFHAVDSLRAAGRYEEARTRLDAVGPAPAERARWPWRAAEARRLGESLDRILAAPPGARAAIHRADSLSVVARRRFAAEDYIGAMSAAAEQLDLRQRWLGPSDADVAASLDLLGRIAYAAGEGVWAEECHRQALAIRRAGPGRDHPGVAESLRNLAVVLQERRQRGPGGECLSEALSIAERAYAPDDTSLAPILETVASYHRRWGEAALAERFHRRALAIRRAAFGPRSVPVAENLLWLGHAQLCAGHFDAAKRSLAEAETLLAANGLARSHPMGDATLFSGMIAWLRDDPAGAIARWRRSFACPHNTVRNHAQGYGLKRLPGMREEWIDAQLAEGHPDEAWREVCRGSGPVARSLMDFARGRRADPALSVTVDSLRACAVDARRRLADAASAASAAPEVVVPRMAALARAEAARREAERRLVDRIPVADGSSPALADLQARLRPDAAMIGWVNAKWAWPGIASRWSIWGWVVRDRGPVHWVHYGTWRTHREYGDHFRFLPLMATIDKSSRWPHRVAPDPSLDSLAVAVGATIMGPLLPHLAGATEVVICGRPGPFSEMVLSPEFLRDDHGVTFNERFAFSYTPSPEAFVRLAGDREAGRAAGPASIVAVADPLGPARATGDDRATVDLAGIDDRPGSSAAGIGAALFRSAVEGDRAALARLPVLPFARSEAMKVTADFPRRTLLVGPEARESSLESVLRRAPCEVLHLATHALIDDSEPERSTLVMAREAAPPGRDDDADDGRITAGEVLLGWKLDAGLVTLSGCRTSDGPYARGGEELGFAQAFLAAGANALLMSRWPVDDRATALLMGRFYENLTGSYEDARRGLTGVPMSRARALQEAQLWLRDRKDPDGRATFAHPVYWAGFVLIGNGD
jgi:tetratricopeptide (TPR) repeat protein